MVIRVVVVDDHPVVREGVRAMMTQADGIEVIGEAESGSGAFELVKTLQPDVVLLDVRMPGMDGIQTTKRIKRAFPGVFVLLLTICEEDAYLFEGVRAGADGYLLKNSRRRDLIDAVQSVARGEKLLDPRLLSRAMQELGSLLDNKLREESGLSDSDLETLHLAANGMTNREIGDRVGLSEVTVKKRLQTIYEKLGATDRAQAVAEAIRKGLIA